MNMKKIILLLSITLGILISAQAQKGHDDWLTDYDTAIKQAKKENKTVLMAFSGSDWCRPCIMLSKEVFEKDIFKKYAHENYVLLYVNFPRKSANKLSAGQQAHNDRLAKKFNKEGDFPKVILIDKEGNIKGSLGYIAGGAENYIKKLKAIK